MKFKVLLSLLLLQSLFAHTLWSNSNIPEEEDPKVNCRELLEHFDIDVDIKSYKGWMRVCNNGKLSLYTSFPLSRSYEEMLCGCFEETSRNRDVEIKNKKR